MFKCLYSSSEILIHYCIKNVQKLRLIVKSIIIIISSGWPSLIWYDGGQIISILVKIPSYRRVDNGYPPRNPSETSCITYSYVIFELLLCLTIFSSRNLYFIVYVLCIKCKSWFSSQSTLEVTYVLFQNIWLHITHRSISLWVCLYAHKNC